MTAQSKVSEFQQKLGSQKWRISNIYYIVDKSGKKVLFRPNRAQRRFLNGCKNRDIILKARQLGFTTLACIIGLDECLFKRDWAVLLIAHTNNDATKIFENKVRFAYDNLPEEIRQLSPARKDRAGLLKFENGSSFEVATSGRSGTYQRVHISEFGKICAKYPEKAREIITGTLPAVGKNYIWIESTAEGQDGHFYKMTQEAMTNANLDREDFRFHFFPWFDDPKYTYDPKMVVLTKPDCEYFDKIQQEMNIKLSHEQMAWWKQQENLLGADMKRENPASPKEAFEQATEGAYFSLQIVHAEKRGSIGRFPYDPMYEVNTFWDLGRNDMNIIWLHQYIGKRNRFIGYYENQGEYIAHYINWLKVWAKEHGALFGEHFWPHDGDRDDLFLEHGRLGHVEMEHKFFPTVVSRVNRKIEGIEAARRLFASCDFDEAECAVGLKHLRLYRKRFDTLREVFQSLPVHDEHSHGADGFQTFATGWTPPNDYSPAKPTIKEALRRDLPMHVAITDEGDSDDGGEVDYWKGGNGSESAW